MTAVLAIFLCFAFSSCNESGDVNIAEEIIIDNIETEESSAAITTITTTSADIILGTAAVTDVSGLPKDTGSESGLSEKPITYDDCVAYCIEDGTVIAFSDYRKQNS